MATKRDAHYGFQIGDIVAVKRPGGSFMVSRIRNRDEFSIFNIQSAVAASGTADFSEVTDLDPATGEFLQVLGIGVDGLVKVRVSQPAGTRRLGVDKSANGGELNEETSPVGGEMPINFVTLPDNSLFIRLENNYPESITSVLRFKGFRYTHDTLADGVSNLEEWRRNAIAKRQILGPMSIVNAGFS